MQNPLRTIPSLHRCARQARRVGRLLTGRDTLYHYDIHPRKKMVGTVYGGWTLVPDALRPNCLVYSFGVGNDISFDVALIEQYGATVHGFDPSPAAIDFIAAYSQLPPQFVFHPFGLAAEKGEIEFFRSCRAGQYSLLEAGDHAGGEMIRLPVNPLPSIMDTLETRYIDVLKMDIEGAEYGVIPDVLAHADGIGQLLIEFHHRIGVASLRQTIECVRQLRSAGFQLYHVSATSSEFSFIHKSASRARPAA